MFGLVALVQSEVDGQELLFLNSQTISTSESSGWEDYGLGGKPLVGLSLPDPRSGGGYDGLVPSAWEDCGPSTEPAVGLPIPSYLDASYYDISYFDASYCNACEYYRHFGFNSNVEMWDDEIDNESDSDIDR